MCVALPEHNYESLLRKVTYSPAMGNYLDMVNNDRPAGTRVPNENYAREILQLFSINLVELNANGTPLLDAQGQQLQTYTQTDIAEFARVFTGYTYAIVGATGALGQRPYYSPTVFNYFMPDTKVPGTSILGPEFGIHTTVTAIGRANLVYTLVYGAYNPDATIPNATGTKLFLAPFEALADQPAAMVSAVNQRLAGGQFPTALEPTIVAAVNAIALSAQSPEVPYLHERPHRGCSRRKPWYVGRRKRLGGRRQWLQSDRVRVPVRG